jgi:hypothetical protein
MRRRMSEGTSAGNDTTNVTKNPVFVKRAPPPSSAAHFLFPTKKAPINGAC